MKEMALIVNDLTVAYHEKPVLWDVDINVPSGTLLGIIGPNGAGKSTFIKSILGIVKPIAGNILIYGLPYKTNRNKVAYVPQRGSVDWDFPITVLDVVMMGMYGELGWIKKPGKKEKVRAMESLKKLGMDEYSNRQINQLSGGQQQRVFLARALVQEADLYLMDEPFQGVDALTEKAIIKLLMELKEQGKTVIVVHHDLQTVTEYFDWVMLLNISCVAIGPEKEVFTKDNLKKTYGDQSVSLIDQKKSPTTTKDRIETSTLKNIRRKVYD
ncbi:metal ABC transporter ATP-binding protein [Alkaliphilus transvaalensis]|uniref:metal ABC transporter ATP-binding protein n=1 Tax=Alkaliphilus transvaalensis TaxID=114628 RepID=UPI000A049018|nr:metal ABC transporter ATP-binding protein [Alkaliphilus transvaalensis]